MKGLHGHIHSQALIVTDNLMIKTGAMTAALIYGLLYSDKTLPATGSHLSPVLPAVRWARVWSLTRLEGYWMPCPSSPRTRSSPIVTPAQRMVQPRQLISVVLVCGRELKPREVRWLTKDSSPRPTVPWHRQPFII